MNTTSIIPAWEWHRVWTSNRHYRMHTDSSRFCANMFQTVGGWRVVIADAEGDTIHTIENIDTFKAAKMAGYRSLLGHC